MKADRDISRRDFMLCMEDLKAECLNLVEEFPLVDWGTPVRAVDLAVIVGTSGRDGPPAVDGQDKLIDGDNEAAGPPPQIEVGLSTWNSVCINRQYSLPEFDEEIARQNAQEIEDNRFGRPVHFSGENSPIVKQFVVSIPMQPHSLGNGLVTLEDFMELEHYMDDWADSDEIAAAKGFSSTTLLYTQGAPHWTAAEAAIFARVFLAHGWTITRNVRGL